MKKLLLPLSILALLSCILLCSCNPSTHIFGNSKNWIPENYAPQNTILLVEKFTGSKKEAKKMEDYMAEKYSFKYEFVSLATIHNREGKYADTKLYRYALISLSGRHVMNTTNSGSTTNGIVIEDTDYNFYDRDLHKNYPPTKRPSSFASMTFKALINTLEKEFN